MFLIRMIRMIRGLLNTTNNSFFRTRIRRIERIFYLDFNLAQKAQKTQNFPLLCNAKAGIFTQLVRVESTERNVESLRFNEYVLST